MIGYIAFWNGTSGKIIVCPGNIKVFPFVLSGVADPGLAEWLQQVGSYSDPGPCPGKVRVQFLSQDGMAVGIQRIGMQVTFQSLATPTAAFSTQPLRSVNRLPISNASLSLVKDSPLSGQLSAGLEIHHPKAAKPLNSTLNFSLNKPKDARVVLTVHHGDKTHAATFPFGKTVSGKRSIRLKTPPQPGLPGTLHVAVHAHIQRKDKSTKANLKLHSLDIG